MSFRPKAKGAVGCFRGTDQTTGKGGRKKQVMLSITLNHGDIVIMHGRDIQKYYEVSAINHDI
jgi:alkylated DNA repair dioxygenase AlkB